MGPIEGYAANEPDDGCQLSAVSFQPEMTGSISAQVSIKPNLAGGAGTMKRPASTIAIAEPRYIVRSAQYDDTKPRGAKNRERPTRPPACAKGS